MKKLYLYYLIFLLTTIICGCQEQPNTEIIINKMETEQNLYKDAEEYTPYLAQEKWNEIVSGKDVTYVFDAEICIPDVNAYPIYEVLPSFFEFDKLDNIIRSLVPNPRIKIEEVDLLTKDQIRMEMDLIIQSINLVDKNHPEFSEEEKNNYLSSRNEDLAYMQELYNNAPEEIETREIKSTSEMRSETSTRTNVRVYNEQDNPELICEMNMTKGDNRVATFSIFPYKAYDIKLHTFVPIGEMPIPRIEMSKEVAAETAQAFVEYVGINNNYSLNCVYEDMAFYDGLVAVFTPSYSGIESTYAVPAILPYQSQDLEFFRIWPAEVVLVYLDSNYNICRFEWKYPARIGKMINANAELMSFDSVKEQIKKSIKLMSPDMPYWDGIEHRQIVIERIELGIMRVKRSGTSDAYILLPVWDCFGYLIDHYRSQEESEYRLDENNDAIIDENDGVGTFLTISALDGSIIDRKFGY